MKTKHIDTEVARIALIEMAEEAIEIIRKEDGNGMEIEEKLDYDGLAGDFATNGDKKAQAMYVRRITQQFPGFGIIAEEKNLAVPCTIDGHDIYITVDPLDGTKAYKRRQPFGIGTMIALVYDGEVIVAVVGDACTGEIFSFAKRDDGKQNAWHKRFSKTDELRPAANPLNEQYLVLREMPRLQPDLVNRMIDGPGDCGLFKNGEVSNGSIGTQFARLWSGCIGGIVLPAPAHNTPWDDGPIIGMSKHLGFRHFRINLEMQELKELVLETKKEITKRDQHELVIHESHIGELEYWLQQNTAFTIKLN